MDRGRKAMPVQNKAYVQTQRKTTFLYFEPNSLCVSVKLKTTGIDNKNDNIKYSHSLNKERRKRELQKITQQNHQILRRIQQARARPLYNH